MPFFAVTNSELLRDTVVVIALTFLSPSPTFCQWDGERQPQWDPGSFSGLGGESPDPFGYAYTPCQPDNPWPCQPPFYPYDIVQVEIPNVGWVAGRTMIYQEAPFRYVNWFLGVPYAKPPIKELRFKKPVDPGPGWDENARVWDASYYRDVCPQPIWHVDEWYFYPRNVSENCLHLNIFAPNLTDKGQTHNRDYPVLVFVNGEDYKLGDSMLNPGHIVAKKEVMVITFNYRLGAMGFMSTLDQNSPGNYGLYDVLKVLEFIQRYITEFRGDPDRVTLVGSDSGAGLISLLILSPLSRQYNGYKPLFHQAILMSGADTCEWAHVGEIYGANALTYAKELGRQAGCDPDYGVTVQQMVACLRQKHFSEIVNASEYVYRMHGSQAGPFGPVVDGVGGVLPDTPTQLRKSGNFLNVKLVAGLNKDEGSYIVGNITKDMPGVSIAEGLEPDVFRDILTRMVRRRSSIKNVDEVVGAMEFEYTFWAKPDNVTAVRQNLIDLWSDMRWGWCIDELLKSHVAVHNHTPVYMYVFGHRSEYEILSPWMGVPHNQDTKYFFGYPFFNETLGNITGIVPQQWDWTLLDRNMSVFVQDMWTNFTKYGVPMTEWTRNTTWYPFTQYNLSYLWISEWSYMEINFRQNHYAFWREYFPLVASKWPVTTTPNPTPLPLIEYQIATWCLVGVAVIALVIVIALGISFWRTNRSY